MAGGDDRLGRAPPRATSVFGESTVADIIFDWKMPLPEGSRSTEFCLTSLLMTNLEIVGDFSPLDVCAVEAVLGSGLSVT